MNGEGNGLTLEGLAQRLEALERENAELRHEVVALRGSGTHRAGELATEFDGQMSRRSLLSKAGVAAVAAMAAGVILPTREAKAHHSSSWNIGAGWEWLSTHYITAYPETDRNAVYGQSTGASATVEGRNLGTGPAVRGYSTYAGASGAGVGVVGEGKSGVVGKADYTGNSGVSGIHTGTGGGYGVVGDGKGAGSPSAPFAGVLGRNSSGHGVRGEGQAGVVGKSSTTGYEGIYGQHTGTSGYGVVGDGTGSSGAGVLGRNSSGYGVQGQGTYGVRGQGSYGVYGSSSTTGTTGIGVYGSQSGQGTGLWGSSTGGYGGQFSGGKAQLRLVPGTTASKPTSGVHTKGEIYMDSTATLWVCTATGTPGTWRKVTTTVS